MIRLDRSALPCVIALLLLVVPLSAGDFDWPYWRGPQMDGHSPLTNLPDKWDPKGGEGSNLIWAREDLGSRSTPIVMDGLLYTLVRHGADTQEDSEKLVCLDAATGETKWEVLFPVYLSDVPAERVGWTSVVGDAESHKVFALGVCGLFRCISTETQELPLGSVVNGQAQMKTFEAGEIIWEHSLHEEYGLLSTYGGRTNFPIVHEDNVIVSAVVIGWGEMAKPAHRFIAFDQRNGQPAWFTGTRLFPADTTYSAPILGSFDGQLAMVFASGDGSVNAFQPRTGKSLWKYNVSNHGINLTPLVVGDRVYCGHSEENLDSTRMGALFALDATKEGDITQSGEIWRELELNVGRSTPLMVDGKLYAIDDRAKLHIVDPETGKQLGEERLGSVQRSSPLYADGKIYTITENGVWYTLRPNDSGGVDVVHKMRLKGESTASIIAAEGRLYVPLSSGLYCVGDKDAEPQGDPEPFELAETPKDEDTAPAQVQVVPVEALLTPGQRQPYQVRLYNAAGQFLRLAKANEVAFSAAGPGEISADGVYTIPATHNAHSPVIVTAKVENLEGKARIRVIPPLNWSFDFNDGQVPITWVGTRYRNVPIDFDFWSKLNEQDPQAASLYIYFQTGFVNVPQQEATFDDTTPAQTWTTLLGFLRLKNDKPRTIEEAQAKLGNSLETLVNEKFLASADFSTWERTVEGKTVDDLRLKVTKGERKIDGNGVMCKISTIPLGTRSQGWMGPPSLSNYTLQADVYAFNRDDSMPDIGLIAQRYTLFLMGVAQQLRIRAWSPQLRAAADGAFAWEPHTWYTVKFHTSVEDGKAVLRGKAWKRGETEPADWQITLADEFGQHQGSPGLFGDAKISEILYDNLTVTANTTDDASTSKTQTTN